MDLLCISKVSLLFCVFLIRLKNHLHACRLMGQGLLMWDLCGRHVATTWWLTGLYFKTFRPDESRPLDSDRMARMRRAVSLGGQNGGGAAVGGGRRWTG